MRVLKHFSLLVVLLCITASAASAQSWRGMGRVAGKVTDEQGKPLAGVTIKLNQPGAGGTTVTSDKSGEWGLGGIHGGEWQVDFELATYEPRHITLQINELSRIPPVEVKLKQDINEVIRVGVVKAGDLVGQQKYVEARGVYQDILTRYPNAYRIESYLARVFYLEKNFDESIKHLKIAIDKDPSDLENKLRLGNILMEQGRMDEGRQVLATVDDTAVKDPAIFVNIGISLMNQNKADEALVYFDKAVKVFPDKGDGYYYRGLIRLQKGDTAGTKDDFAKFLQLSPNAPEAAAARKALEQLK
ncbi:MAG: tetratricopeptide repeat protein [Acidobacteriota bacterium]